ncbi:hypothetical protein [Mariniblastus fucicola]|uniref:Uncharacterized protein n=1 Tax=Mariniblastus fucicola TaxID=980251 RepID=A0A5B9P9Q8_9BACT|nr:hypothetical protein [Mariniblastus fucicola]QEG21975.1 hypothetical protein MFFC18_18360 [Mariniblastus fucicola]
MNDWAVYRLDYNANEFLVEKGLSKEKADHLAAMYIGRGHHQHYWVDKQPPHGQDFHRMLKEMLDSGSTSKIALRVLTSQGATHEQCLNALTQCTSMTVEECQALLDESIGN